MRYLSVLLLAAAAFAGDARLNGRWDITPDIQPRNRGWWLEINGAETSSPSGRFVTAYNGDMNVIQEISVNGSELMFAFTPQVRPQPGETPRKPDHLVYKARLAGDKLEGTFQAEGSNRPIVKWTGVRAPVIPDKDDGSWKEGKPVSLIGKELSNWKSEAGGPATGWVLKDGVLAISGRANNIISDAKFWNFKLHLEYKVAEHSNSGVGLRARYEVQILDDYGRQPGTHNSGALYARIPPSENASKPAGEWQTYDIRLVGRQVTIVHNGKTVIDKGEVEGLTAVAIDANEAEPGPIYLQGDHGAVEFRKIVVTPLVKK